MIVNDSNSSAPAGQATCVQSMAKTKDVTTPYRVIKTNW